jgi:hypothetical protein
MLSLIRYESARVPQGRGRRSMAKGPTMKVHIEIDCSPDEARRFMGLPDVDRANAVYVDTLAKAMKGVSNADQLEQYAKQLAPMGQMGLKIFQSFVDGAAKANTSRESEAPKADE